MSFNIDSQYVFYAFAAFSVILFVEAIYLLFFSNASYRKRINRRLDLMKDRTDRDGVLVQLRRERGLTSDGDFRLPLEALNRLILQSGLSTGVGRLCIYVIVVATIALGAVMLLHGDILYAAGLSLFCCTLGPLLWLRILRGRRRKKFGTQFADAIDIIIRSLRAGHPVPIAISMVGREMPDPVGSEFGIVSDEVAYGADLETAMRNLFFRVGQEDLPLFVTAVAIQGSTGGNLSEILENLSNVIRLRFKMRRKVKALAAEGRASAIILASLPVGIFLIINLIAPDFYRSVWHFDVTKITLGVAMSWMLLGILIMHRMVNFKI